MPSKIEIGDRDSLPRPSGKPTFDAYPSIRVGDRNRYVYFFKKAMAAAGCKVDPNSNEFTTGDQTELDALVNAKGLPPARKAADKVTQEIVFATAFPELSGASGEGQSEAKRG